MKIPLSLLVFVVVYMVFSQCVWLDTELSFPEKAFLTVFLAVVLSLTETALIASQNPKLFVHKGAT
jgi:hypothetical protein